MLCVNTQMQTLGEAEALMNRAAMEMQARGQGGDGEAGQVAQWQGRRMRHHTN